MMHCIMQAAIDDEFSQKSEEAYSEDMLKMLNESFGTPDDVEWYKTSCAILNTQMREGASITNHILYMIE